MRVLSLGCMLLVGASAGACGKSDSAPPEPPRERADKPPQTADQLARLSPSKRLIGTWVLDLAHVADTALTDELRQLRQRGLAGKVSVEYTFRDGEFVMRKDGAGGPVERRFRYEIVDEQEDRLELRRLDDEGEPQRIYVRFEGRSMQFGQGDSAVQMTRK